VSEAIPIVRLEVERMKQTIVTALTHQALQLDRDIQTAVESYCTERNIAALIQGEVNRVLDSVIAEEVKRFFQYGEGRKVVAEAVKKRLLDGTTFTPLDEIP
jgi:hypothetical protein